MPQNTTSNGPDRFAIETNYPRALRPEEISQLRGQTVEQLRALLDMRHGYGETAWETDPVSAVYEMHDAPEAQEQQRRALATHLQIAQRYLEQSLEVDAYVCGSKEQKMPGIRLPILRMHQQGKHGVVITTRNTWGSKDYRDPAEQGPLKEQLRQRFTVGDHFDEAAYDRELHTLTRPADTSADMPVLNEEDRVDFFDEKGERIGSGVVREVAGNEISLHVQGKSHIHRASFLRKKSNANAIRTSMGYVSDYADRLDISDDMRDRNGHRMGWRGNASSASPWESDGDSISWRTFERDCRLTGPEQAFFAATSPEEARDVTQQEMSDRGFSLRDIPRAIVDDPEQCAAFALGASGYPCSIIQGPPGTGKTTVASHLAEYFQKHGLKTLICSHSNRGLDVLLRAVRKRGVQVHRGGTDINMCDRELQDHFIRKNLHHPRHADFLVPTFDEKGFAQAQRLFESGDSAEAPRRDEYVTLTRDKQAWREAWRVFEQEKQRLIAELKEKNLVAGVTLNSLLSDEIIQALPFDVLIVDEASKGYIHELLPALQKAGKQIIFIGDHKQLGNIDLPPHFRAFLRDADADDSRRFPVGTDDVHSFENGPFALLAEESAVPKVMLRTNRRSLHDIVALVSHAGYGGKLRAGREDKEHPENTGTLLWVDTSKRPDKGEHAAGVSKINHAESRLIARRLHRDFEKGNLDPSNFGVITMYRAQGSLIRRKADKLVRGTGEQQTEFGRMLRRNTATVDGFQGSERQRIYLATTRSNERGTVGFLENVRRVNVACSRAQDCLIIYGDRETLIENNPDPESRAYFEAAYAICKKRGTVIDTFSDLPANAKEEAQLSQTHAARRARARRAFKRKQREVPQQ